LDGHALEAHEIAIRELRNVLGLLRVLSATLENSCSDEARDYLGVVMAALPTLELIQDTLGPSLKSLRKLDELSGD
jgi:hypothetical protein